jgi:hypothetical protein
MRIVNRNREGGDLMPEVPPTEKDHMTSRKITLEEACDAWRYEHREVESGHLASSALFDLMHQNLDEEEQRQAFRHLAECTACLQHLEAMLKIKGLTLTVEGPLAAAGGSLSTEPASAHANKAVNGQGFRGRHRDATTLTLLAQPEHHSD